MIHQKFAVKAAGMAKVILSYPQGKTTFKVNNAIFHSHDFIEIDNAAFMAAIKVTV
jgi:hypothetical protein